MRFGRPAPARVLVFWVTLASFSWASGCASRNPAPPPSGAYTTPPPAEPERDRDRDRGHGNSEADVAGMLAGRYEGVTPGNNLHVNIQSAGFHSLSHPYDEFIEISGEFDGTNVRQQGFLHIQNQGRGVFIGYIPHFDPTVSALSPRAGHFSASEANAACWIYLEPQGDGFYGETEGQTCAFAIRGAIGRWSLRAEPGFLVVRSVASGETLRFRRVAS